MANIVHSMHSDRSACSARARPLRQRPLIRRLEQQQQQHHKKQQQQQQQQQLLQQQQQQQQQQPQQQSRDANLAVVASTLPTCSATPTVPTGSCTATADSMSSTHYTDSHSASGVTALLRRCWSRQVGWCHPVTPPPPPPPHRERTTTIKNTRSRRIAATSSITTSSSTSTSSFASAMIVLQNRALLALLLWCAATVSARSVHTSSDEVQQATGPTFDLATNREHHHLKQQQQQHQQQHQQHYQQQQQRLHHQHHNHREDRHRTEFDEMQAGKKLLQVFGLKEPKLHNHRPAPQYMLELYNHTATEQGFMRTANPYNANLIRSFTDKVRRRRNFDEHHSPLTSKPFHVPTATALRFYFNVSTADANEELLQAQFHIYKLRPKSRKFKGLLEVRAYQVMPGRTADQEEGNRLLDVRRVAYEGVGWEVFYVKAAVDDWLQDPSLNLGLFLTVRTQRGRRMPDQQFRFARRQPPAMFRTAATPETSAGQPGPRSTVDNNTSGADGVTSHEARTPASAPSSWSSSVSKQPVLVVFSNDGRSVRQDVAASSSNTNNNNRNNSQSDVPARYASAGSDGRSRRSLPPLSPAAQYEVIDASGASTGSHRAGGHHQEPQESCARHDLYVDFEKIGWSSWIISPKGYQAYYCKGSCSFPLGQNQWPTNHATVQSIVNELGLTEGVGKPCCVPNKLYSISLLYYDDSENVILKQYDDMVAASCGCH